MSNYPDDFNQLAFENTIGSRMTPADIVWDALANQLHDVVARAFHDYPLDSKFRRPVIEAAIKKADDALAPFVSIGRNLENRLKMIYLGIIGAEGDGLEEAVQEQIGDYMYHYARAIEAQKEEA